MGPRSFDRGNVRSAYRAFPFFYASMGPRSFDRGNTGARTWEKIGLTCFNGAAIFRPRKRASPDPLSRTPTCFNGAAIFRPRKHKRGRGRDVVHLASMGPRSFDRGNLTLSSGGVSSSTCFNGAAIFRPRKRECRTAGSSANS